MAAAAAAERKHEALRDDQGMSVSEEDQEANEDMPDVHDAAVKIERAKGAYMAYSGLQEKPSKLEIWMWYLYEMCSHFIVTTVVPVVFPLIISEIVSKTDDHDDDQGWGQTPRGIACMLREIKLYDLLTHTSISKNNLNLSAMEWTSISWAIGLILASPLLGLISKQLDHGYNPQLIAGAATTIGSLFCLPVGFIKTPYIFPFYIAAIVASYIVASASHTRQLGLMVRGYTGPTLKLSQFPTRRGVSGWFSVYATAAGGLGSAIFSAFTYHMLRNKKDPYDSLWVVSIFSGLKWLVGMLHVVTQRPVAITNTTSSVPKSYFLSLFKYPYAIASLIVIFMSSFSSTCIFTGGLLFLLGQLCLKPIFFLYFWLIYFIFPSFSMPLLQPLQHVIKADAVRMQLLGFLLALLTSGMGFYYKEKNWQRHHVLLFAAIQSTSAGLLHAFGRVLLLDCTPHGKEGAFSVWHSWVKALGTCTGFAVASAIRGHVSTAFGVSFLAATIGILILIFGNISDVGGAMAAGHLYEDSEKGSPVPGLDTSIIIKEHVYEETA
ncbi:hypothetical protein KPL71_014979 [Citrus sinensis]|uniref:Uncharacterized protein n=3 Tax=Citrus TaxID=2706 RepID=A0ACB8KFJ5_CITSI|nr:hypothetical protein KPL71_014979 [Citrus sinensis]